MAAGAGFRKIWDIQVLIIKSSPDSYWAFNLQSSIFNLQSFKLYSKQEASQLRQEFWKAFGLYMSPILSSDEEKVNWVNYKTGEKFIQIRTRAEGKIAEAAICLTHPDPMIQQIHFEHFQKLQQVFEEMVGEDWHWLLHANEEGRIISKIAKRIEGVNIMRKEDWPALISFFKPNMIALDAFWNMVKHTMEQLR
jgi:hypothetical protein